MDRHCPTNRNYSLCTCFSAFTTYVNTPSTHNSAPINAEVSNQYHIKEGKVVYVRGGNFFSIGEVEIEGADLDTFEIIDKSYAKDINHVYYDGKPVLGGISDSVVLIPSELKPTGANSSYLISGDKVFTYGEEIEGADPASFTLLEGGYAMDKGYIYYYYDEKILRKVTPTIMVNNEYLKHGEQVLYQGKVFSEQASHFEIISDEYSKDLNHVYSHADIVKGMEPESFEILSSYFRKDKNQAYYFNHPIKKSDATSFTILNDTISKDAQYLYYQNYLIQNKQPAELTQSDANDFANLSKWIPLNLGEETVILVPSEQVENITYAFSAYQNEVYDRYQKLEGVKPEDVFVYEDSEELFTRIGSKIFHNGTYIPNADPGSFTPISDNFSKDTNNVYWFENKVTDADPLTFKYEQALYAAENEVGEYVLKIADY